MSATAGGRLTSVLVGEVRTAEFALRGLLRAGLPPVAILTTDVLDVGARTAMAEDYYADLAGAGADAGIPVTVVSDLTDEAGRLRELAPDCIWIMGWPYLVREPVLQIATCIGMHPTPLPLRRGGAPMNWTLLDGETRSAVSLFRMERGLDDGDLIAQRHFDVGEDTYVAELADRIYEMTESLVSEAATALARGDARWVPQEDRRATYTRRRVPADGLIRWNDSATRIRNLIRAVSRPFPGAFTFLDGDYVTVWKAEVPHGYRAPLKAEPATILAAEESGVLVSTRDNALRLTEAQVAGDESVSGTAMKDAFSSFVGGRFDDQP